MGGGGSKPSNDPPANRISWRQDPPPAATATNGPRSHLGCLRNCFQAPPSGPGTVRSRLSVFTNGTMWRWMRPRKFNLGTRPAHVLETLISAPCSDFGVRTNCWDGRRYYRTKETCTTWNAHYPKSAKRILPSQTGPCFFSSKHELSQTPLAQSTNAAQLVHQRCIVWFVTDFLSI